MKLFRFGFVIFSLLLSSIAVASDSPAIQGYSVVSYFEYDRAELGSEKYSASYQDKTYWFVSSQQVQTFKQNPQKYVPLFDAFCPYSLTLGMRLPIDPQNFKVSGGRLMLFHVNESKNGLIEWNKAQDEEELLRRAHSEFFRLSL